MPEYTVNEFEIQPQPRPIFMTLPVGSGPEKRIPSYMSKYKCPHLVQLDVFLYVFNVRYLLQCGHLFFNYIEQKIQQIEKRIKDSLRPLSQWPHNIHVKMRSTPVVNSAHHVGSVTCTSQYTATHHRKLAARQLTAVKWPLCKLIAKQTRHHDN